MNLLSLLKSRWNSASSREQRWLLGGLVVVLAALLWWVGLAPALATLRTVERQQGALDAQAQQMLALQAQAKLLQAQPRLAPDEIKRTLEASARQFGTTAQLVVAGERVTLTLKGASADLVAQWLAQARLNARVLPSEARLTRSANAAPGAAATWDGMVVLNLNAR